MRDGINRRDFLNGAALTIASGLTPAAQLAAKTIAPPFRYPPAITGLRGHHAGAFEAAHEFAREGKAFPYDKLPVEEHYDLVVVGGGISGLAAAWFYRKQHGPKARILVLDNHDDFGGHAKRNEFNVDGRRLIGYGGSESLQSPNADFSPVVKKLMQELGVEVKRFETAFERSFYPKLGLSRAVFLPRESFGRDALMTGDPTMMVADDLTPELLNARSIGDFIAGFPLSDKGKAELLGLYQQTTNPLPGKTAEEKIKTLKTTSYRDYLIKICGVGAEVANCFQGRTLDYFALGIDAVSAFDAKETNYPGFAGLGLPKAHNPDAEEPYIYHFPDGNASIARLLVRALIPDVAPRGASSRGMDSIVQAKFDYAKLDLAKNRVRVRLDSICIGVRQTATRVDLGYVQQGRLRRVTADHAVLACFNMIIPHLMPDLPEPQRDALAKNVKAPLVYTNVAVRNWEPWIKLGVHEISAPMSFHCRVKLDYPVDLGGYRHPREAHSPICIHMVHVPGEPGQTARDQFKIGRYKLLDMSFEQLETHIRGDLDRMLGAGGFSSARDIAAITVNRWSHGYAYSANSLFDGDDADAIMELARRPAGRVTIANSDSQWSAYAHSAIDAAERAVRELPKG